MASVTVYFGGICTFFTKPRPELHGDCRAVLVNASEKKHIDGKTIAEHHARVKIIDGEQIVDIEPQGLHMRLVPATVSPLDLDQFNSGAFNLTKILWEQSQEHLSEPSRPVVFDGNPDAALLYFDFSSGVLEVRVNEKEATVAVLRSPAATLHSAPFEGRTLPLGLPAEWVLSDGAEIHVTNDDDIKAAAEHDFLLHYLTAARLPDHPAVPPGEERSRVRRAHDLPGPLNAIGSGCSNSNYP
jgi:hypothetical protein